MTAVAALAGGVGAAKLLTGMIQVVDQPSLTIVANTGDDTVMHGLTICPDIDTLVYTLAGAVNPETGWGLTGETWNAMDALDRYGGPTWFRLGDRDLGTHLYRTGRLGRGATLSEVTAEIARSWGLSMKILPMSDQPVATRVTLAAISGETDPPGEAANPRKSDLSEEVGFQDYFVRMGHQVAVSGLCFQGADRAAPAPGVLDALDEAGAIVICPSNPLVSIGPILSVAGIADRLTARRDRVVAVSPIVAGAALKGPADRMMTELGHEATVVGVARLYTAVASSLVIDHADAALAGAVEEIGMKCIVTRTIMDSPAVAAELARVVLASAG